MRAISRWYAEPGAQITLGAAGGFGLSAAIMMTFVRSNLAVIVATSIIICSAVLAAVLFSKIRLQAMGVVIGAIVATMPAFFFLNFRLF
jgi:hypothetical protein